MQSPRTTKHPKRALPVAEYSAGGIVFRKTSQGYEFVLIQDGYRKWTFPKGRIEKGETPENAAIAEVEEEAGIRDPRIIGKIGVITLMVRSRFERPYPFKKKVFFFLIKTRYSDIKREQDKPSVLDARWVKKDDVVKFLGYKNMRQFFGRAIEMLKNIE